MFNKAWQEEVFSNPKCINYRMYKTELKFEKYLVILQPKLRISMTKIRLMNHLIPIEAGRYAGIDRQDRKCKICDIYAEEYHMLFECFVDEKKLFLPQLLQNRTVSCLEFKEIMNTNNFRELTKLAKLIDIIISVYSKEISE